MQTECELLENMNSVIFEEEASFPRIQRKSQEVDFVVLGHSKNPYCVSLSNSLPFLLTLELTSLR